MTPRVRAFLLLYLGAAVAGLETAAELILETLLAPLPSVVVLAARAAQVGGLLVALLGVVLLARQNRTLAPTPSGLGAFLDAERTMRAYYREVLVHALGAGLVLLLGLAYAFVLYLRVLQTRPDHWYFFVVILASFTVLALAWWLPARRLLAEDRRLRAEALAQEA